MRGLFCRSLCAATEDRRCVEVIVPETELEVNVLSVRGVCSYT